jgi:hypothetical protein
VFFITAHPREQPALKKLDLPVPEAPSRASSRSGADQHATQRIEAACDGCVAADVTPASRIRVQVGDVLQENGRPP